MTQPIARPFGVPNPAVVSEVESRLGDELRNVLLLMGSGSSDTRIQELRKAVERKRNRAGDTVAALLTHAFNNKHANPEAFASTIRDFFSSRSKKLTRKLRELSPIETREEGEINCLQVAIDQGDHSAPTLKRFIAEIDEYMSVLMEMRAAAAWEIYRAENRA